MIYLLQVSTCWILFYLIYLIFYKNETFFAINRYYLLGALTAGLVIPLIGAYLPANTTSTEVYHVMYTVTSPAVEISQEAAPSFTWLTMLWVVYGIGVAIALSKVLYGLLKIRRIYKSGTYEEKEGYTLVKSSKVHMPFSFMKYVFISEEVPFRAEIEHILKHEQLHVSQWHSLDILYAEVLQAFFWFNPILVFYKKSLRQSHEYLADAYVLDTHERYSYGQLLLGQSHSGLEIALANHFFNSQIKKRIKMMYKEKSERPAIMKYLAAIPVLAILLLVFSSHIGSTTPKWDKEKVKQQILTDFNYYQLNSDYFMSYIEILETQYPDNKRDIAKIFDEVGPIQGIQFSLDYDQEGYSKCISWETVAKTINQKPKKEGEDTVSDNINIIGSNVVVKLTESEILLNGTKVNTKNLGEIFDRQRGNKVYVTLEVDNKVEFTRVNEIMKLISDYGYKTILKEKIDRNPNTHQLEVKHENKLLEENKDYSIKDGRLSFINEIKTPVQVSFVNSENEENDLFLNGELINEGVTQVKPPEIKTVDVKGSLEQDQGYTLAADKMSIQGDGKLESDPLVVINGKIIPDGQTKLQAINPNDIAIINVLKGEVALEKYGEKGKDGVIEVTLKKGVKFNADKAEEVYKVVEQMPRFPGCEDMEGNAKTKEDCAKQKMLEYIYTNIKYPAEARTKSIQGMVVVQFVVDKSGDVRDAKIIRSIGGGCDEASLEVVNSFPEWVPGMQAGKNVSVQYVLPIRFKLEGKEVSEEPKEDKENTLDVVSTLASNDVYTEVDQQAWFPGTYSLEESQKALLQAVFSTIKYPKEAKENGIEGMNVIKFVITKGGNIKDIKIAKSIGWGTDEACMAMMHTISDMGMWQPAKKEGKDVAMEYTLPIKFKLQGDEKDNLNDRKLQGVETFPNPSDGKFTIKFVPDTDAPVTIMLYDVAGRVLYMDENIIGKVSTQIDVTEYNVSMAILNVIQGEAIHTEQIVIKK